MEFPEKESKDIIESIHLQTKLLKFGFAQAEFFLIDSSSMPFWSCIFNIRTYTYTLVSTNVKYHLGYSADEMEGAHFKDFISQDEVERAVDYIKENNSNTPSKDDWFEVMHRHKTTKELIPFIWFSPKSQWEKSHDVFSIGFNLNMIKLL